MNHHPPVAWQLALGSGDFFAFIEIDDDDNDDIVRSARWAEVLGPVAGDPETILVRIYSPDSLDGYDEEFARNRAGFPLTPVKFEFARRLRWPAHEATLQSIVLHV